MLPHFVVLLPEVIQFGHTIDTVPSWIILTAHLISTSLSQH